MKLQFARQCKNKGSTNHKKGENNMMSTNNMINNSGGM